MNHEEPTHTNGDTDWPGWLVGINASTSAQLLRIEVVHGELRKLAETPYVHRRVSSEQYQKQLAIVKDTEAVSTNPNGEMTPAAKQFNKVETPQWFTVATAIQMADAHRTLGHMSAGSVITVVRLLDGFKLCTLSGDFLIPLITLRSLFEHVAALQSVLLAIEKLKANGSSERPSKLVMKIGEEITKRAYGTRIDWSSAVFQPVGAMLERKELKYKPKPDVVDRTSKQILNAIDELDEAIGGVRSVYEILCEFAHPNLGAIVLSTEILCASPDELGICWDEHTLRSGPPVHFVRSAREMVPRILEQTAVCLEHYVRTRAKVNKARDMLFGLGQLAIREFVAKCPKLFAPYSPCPCGSGKKLKFCCGSKLS